MSAQVGRPAPDFSVMALHPSGDFKPISLSDYKGKYLLIVFYPADFTFVCPSEIVRFNDMASEFRKNGCEVIIGSTDGEYVHLAWTQTRRAEGGLGKMDVPLFADRNGEVARSYGVLMDTAHIALRGTFLIDGKGILRHATVNDT
eukprot:gnl/Chilomastix_caulleri/2514.p1 GENE.gnl/Chilomastix_caulleri/2514~~gnl/Chilomastix_caulleri/2514.p1  ORF type:complete len:145 (-),score=26.97 gnl/Chilomastix_caulleri/2514:31-465(-)